MTWREEWWGGWETHVDAPPRRITPTLAHSIRALPAPEGER